LKCLKKVLAVQNIACETLGRLEELFIEDGFAIEKTNAQFGDVPAKSSGYSALVILGGSMAVYDDLPYLQKEQDLIRDAIKNNVPVLGICLGSQLIAQATGGRVFKGRKKEIGWYNISLSEQGQKGLFSGVYENRMKVFQWHGDTYELPDNSTILAFSDMYPQAFKIGSALGVQFHLEVDEDLIRNWIREYDAEVRSERLDARSILPTHNDLIELEKKCKIMYRNFTAMVR
jgi:GMP synthase (glutamine-hydrolysing)